MDAKFLTLMGLLLGGLILNMCYTHMGSICGTKMTSSQSTTQISVDTACNNVNGPLHVTRWLHPSQKPRQTSNRYGSLGTMVISMLKPDVTFVVDLVIFHADGW